MKLKVTFCFIALSLILVYGCEKHCRNVKLPKISGGSGFEELSDAILYPGRTILTTAYHNTNFLVTDSIAYDTLFRDKKVFGEINFNERMLIGVNKTANPNNGIDDHVGVFVNNSSSILKLKVDYSLKDQCNGSGLAAFTFEVWANVPKSLVNYEIIYEVTDINPF